MVILYGHTVNTPMRQSGQVILSTVNRVRLWYGLLVLIFIVFGIRLFYLQVIRHQHYEFLASSNQLKQYEIPAERGAIYARTSNGKAPVVLNEVRYTLYADPKYIKDSAKAALAVQKIMGGDVAKYAEKMTKDGSRYEILGKLLTRDQNKAILDLKLKGVGTQPANYRTYPQGNLAAQLLGYVNDDGVGTYGVEQALNNELKGKPGQLKAITDASGVPLAANRDNLIINPVAGKEVLLTIDLGIQAELEQILAQGLKDARSESGGALIIDVKTGAIRAMANLPTFNPSEYYKVEDARAFTNETVSAPLEVGSIMKPLIAAAALNEAVVNPDTTYYDPARITIDDSTVKNIEEDGGPGTRSVADILQLSLNTGATWLLMQLGGGEINEKGRVKWHDYMVNKYGFGKTTGVEQGYETGGAVPDPKKGYGLNIQYANTAFGQGMTATPLQMGAALAAVVNGGNYYRPHLVEAYIDDTGQKLPKAPEVVRAEVVKSSVSKQMTDLMQNIIAKNYQSYGMSKPDPAYMIGGKTGTAEVPRPGNQGGGYYTDKFNGMFMGFVGGDSPQYVIVVRVNEPKIAGYAGSKAAAPIFGKLVNMLINNSSVSPHR